MNTQANTPRAACTLMRPADVSRITGMKRNTLYKGTSPSPFAFVVLSPGSRRTADLSALRRKGGASS